MLRQDREELHNVDFTCVNRFDEMRLRDCSSLELRVVFASVGELTLPSLFIYHRHDTSEKMLLGRRFIKKPPNLR